MLYALVSSNNEILEYRDLSEVPVPTGHPHKPRLLPVTLPSEKHEEGKVADLETSVENETVVQRFVFRDKTEEELAVETNTTSIEDLKKEIETLKELLNVSSN